MSEYRRRGVVRKGKYAPIHYVVARCTLPDGTRRYGLFAMDDVAREQMTERKMFEGTEWKCEPKQVRNVYFWRLTHKLGQWLAENHDDFHGLDAHEALKQLQQKSGIGCNITRSDIRDNNGVLLYRVVSYQPLSLAFDLMEESEFRLLWEGAHEERGAGGWVGWMRRHLYPNMPEMTVKDIERLVIGREVEWADEIEKQ